ncbi:MAG: DUF5676 family membrane protein [Vicinamibacterales bacterium]
MLNIKVWTMSLGCLGAISFAICVLSGLLLPGLPVAHQALELVLPGFAWISPGSVLLGLVDSFLYGAYLGVLFVPLHNYFARRWAPPVPGSARVTRA